MEINTRRLEMSPRLRVLTQTEVKNAHQEGGGWSVELTSKPQYVNERCTACGECVKVCPATVPNEFNLEMDNTSAISLPHPDAWPARMVLHRSACPDGCTKCVEACQYQAIDLDAKTVTETIQVASVVVATGWQPYPLANLPELGGGLLPDVISNVQMERMASTTGPTGGKIERPSDGRTPSRVAFVQCAGSRDINHLPYCSAVCCLASLKQAIYVREKLPSAEVVIFYIDRRAPGRNEDMLTKVAEMDGVRMVKGKVGRIEKSDGSRLVLHVEDVESGTLKDEMVDLVVLATGMTSNLATSELPFNLKKDDDGFALDTPAEKVLVAGVAKRPEDVAASVRDATGASAKAIIAAERGL
jgi:quinone-modifying oxidoreductase subunit QmoA